MKIEDNTKNRIERFRSADNTWSWDMRFINQHPRGCLMVTRPRFDKGIERWISLMAFQCKMYAWGNDR